MLRKRAPQALMIWPYLSMAMMVVINIVCTAENREIVSISMKVCGILTICVYLWNIISVLCYKGEDAAKELARLDFMIKLVHIPFYVLIFAFCLPAIVVAFHPILAMIPFMIWTIFFIVDALLMITSSVYGLRALWKAKKEQRVSKKFAVLHTILHLVFVADVISAICIYRKIKKHPIFRNSKQPR